MSVEPGWYPDPAEPTTQRYWDGEGWVGEALPVDETPPPGPPSTDTGRGSEPQVPAVPGIPGATEAPPSSEVPPSRTREPEVDQRGPDPAAVPPGWSHRQPDGTAAGTGPRPHGFELATPGNRLLARLVDIGLLFLLNVLVNGWLGYQLWNELGPVVDDLQQALLTGDTSAATATQGGNAGNLLLAMLFITTALWLAYEVPAVANTGQTPGKRLLRIKVVRMENTEPLSFGRSFRRWNTMGFPTLLWWCFGIGFVLQLVDALFVPFDRPLHQALHDKSAFTAVVSVPTGDGPSRTETKEDSDEPADPF